MGAWKKGEKNGMRRKRIWKRGWKDIPGKGNNGGLGGERGKRMGKKSMATEIEKRSTDKGTAGVCRTRGRMIPRHVHQCPAGVYRTRYPMSTRHVVEWTTGICRKRCPMIPCTRNVLE